MPETRKWLLPWGMDDNNNPNDPDDPEPTGPASEADNKASARKPPQYTMEFAEIIIPDEGLKEGQPYKFKGKVRRLDGAAPSNASISVQSVYRYNNEEQICGNPEIAEINKDTLEFTGEFDELFEPNAYYLDRNKTSDSKFILILKLRGGCLDKDSFSSEVKLPMATKDYILKKGCYDETWADAKKDDAAYPKSGDKYFPKDTVKKVQILLIKLRFLNTGNDTGYYGDLTELAIHDFQLISKGQKRSKPNDGRIFDIHKADITFKGTNDGIYGPETEKELAQWNANGWVRPKEDFKINDIDENGVRNGHGERGTENYHEGNQILDFQTLLKDIGAYLGKLDGWLGPKTEAAVIWLRECVEKCDFMDATGKKVMLDLKEIIKGHRPKHADEALKKAAEKVKANSNIVPPNNSHSIVKRNGIKVPFYYQLDTKWKDDALGKNRTIGQAGCCVTSLAMVLKYYGRNVNPETLDKYLDTHSGYAGDAVYFDVALKCEEGTNNKLSYNGNRIKSGWSGILDERIKQNKPTIARVKYGSSSSLGGDHFVVIIGKTNDGKYIMNDPGASDGNGSDNPVESNIIGVTKRKSGYTILWLDCITEEAS